MGQKITYIIYGSLLEECGEIPDKHDYWLDWVDSMKEFRELDIQFTGSYESNPEWVGFIVTILDYRDVFDLNDADFKKEKKYWERLQKAAKKAGSKLGSGRLIIAQDE